MREVPGSIAGTALVIVGVLFKSCLIRSLDCSYAVDANKFMVVRMVNGLRFRAPAASARYRLRHVSCEL